MVAIVFVSEGDVVAGDVEDAPHADGDAVGVACQVVEDLLGAGEGLFGINLPALAGGLF